MTNSKLIITGKLIDFNENGVQAARIQFWETEDLFKYFLGEITTNDEGKFEFSFQNEIISGNNLGNLKLKLKIFHGGNFYDYEVTSDDISVTDEGYLDMPIESDKVFVDIKIALNSPKETDPTTVVIAKVFDPDNNPLSGATVALELVSNTDSKGDVTSLGRDISNAQGLLVYQFQLPEDYIQKPDDALQFNIEYSETQIEAVVVENIPDLSESPVNVQVVASTKSEPIISSQDINNAIQQLSLNVSPTFYAYVASNELSDFRSIRRAPIDPDAFAVQEDVDAANKLNKLANLEFAESRDLLFNNFLIEEHNLDSFDKIVAMPSQEFVKIARQYNGNSISDFSSVKIHHLATQKAQFLNSIRASFVMGANFAFTYSNSSYLGNDHHGACSCEECQATVSPLAYLADLLRFTTRYLANRDANPDRFITIDDLEDIFKQPFGQLPADCDTIKENFCQYRIAIEVLRAYREEIDPVNCLEDQYELDEEKYLRTAYFTLLEKLGTSFEEIRSARGYNDEEKTELANRLGLTAMYNGNYVTDLLYLDPQATPPSTVAITEEILESMFGLRHSQRPPFPNLNHPNPLFHTEPAQSLVLSWQLAYIREVWGNEDKSSSLYTGDDTVRDLPIIDPDIIGPDDIRKADPTEDVYKIWLNRRIWLDEHILGVRLRENKITPQTLDAGKILVKIGSGISSTENDYSSYIVPGTEVLLIDSDTNKKIVSKVVDAKYQSSLTEIYLEGILPRAVESFDTLKVNLYLPIDDYTVGSNTTQVDIVTPTPSEAIIDLSGTTLFGISFSRNAESDKTVDGLYKASSSTATSVTVDKELDIDSIEGVNNGCVRVEYEFTDNTHGIEFVEATQKLYLKGDIEDEIKQGDTLTIFDSVQNDGDYIADQDSAYSSTTGATEVLLDTSIESLKSEEASGFVSFIKKDVFVENIDLGENTLLFSQDLAGSLFRSGDLVENTSDISVSILDPADLQEILSSSNIIDYYFSGTETRLKLEDPIPDNANGKILRLNDLTVVITSSPDTFEINNRDLTGVLSQGDTFIVVSSTPEDITYTVDTITYDSNNDKTIITPEEAIDGDNMTGDTIYFNVLIDGIDTSGRKIVAVGELANQITYKNTRVTLYDSVENDIEYTVLGAADIDGYTEIEVKEAFPSNYSDYVSDQQLPEYNLRFNKSVPILDAIPLATLAMDELQTEFYYEDIANVQIPTLPAPGLIPWSFTEEYDELIEYKDLIKQDKEIEANPFFDPITDLNLEVDAFVRLFDLYEKHLDANKDYTKERLTSDEWEEFYNILMSSIKRTFRAKWKTEEDVTGTSQVILSHLHFYFPLTEPKEGRFGLDKVERKLEIPFVDPQKINMDRLPDSPLGVSLISHARGLYQSRMDELKNARKMMKDERATHGFDAMIRLAVGKVFEFGDITVALGALSAGLTSLNNTVVSESEQKVEKLLSMSASDFQQLMVIRNKYTTNLNSVTESELEKSYTILVNSYKLQKLYPVWLETEKQLFLVNYDVPVELTNIDVFHYWEASKARLAKWLASPTERQTWQDQLVARGRRPIVDPDVIGTNDLKSLEQGDPAYPAYELWIDRKEGSDSLETQLTYLSDENNFVTIIPGNPSPPLDPQELLWAKIAYYTDIDFYEFSSLIEQQEEEGINITPRLKQLNLSNSAFRRLKEFNEVILSQSDLLDSEVEELHSILIQVWKQRKYAEWNDVEQGIGGPNPGTQVTLSQDFFSLRTTPYSIFPLELLSLPKWRASYNDRQRWLRTLRSRIEGEEQTIDAFKEYIKSVEERVLPVLRNALVQLCGDDDLSLEENAELLSNRFFIDFKVNCCQDVTRVSQAIETLQQIIWGERTGVLEDSGLNLTLELNSARFEKIWEWLGSYSTWRSSMFVFMYPENLLHPGLRRESSGGFQDALKTIKSKSRFTPEDACEIAHDYSLYFSDISSLKLEATCNTVTTVKFGNCDEHYNKKKENQVFVFGRGNKTNKVYWSVGPIHKSLQQAKKKHGFWFELKALGTKIEKIIGAVPYEMETGERYIYLFALRKEKFDYELVYIRYDLINALWIDTEAQTSLELPKETDFPNVIVKRQRREKCSPTIIYKVGRKDDPFYYPILSRRLNRKGDSWDEAFEFDKMLVPPAKGVSFSSLLDALEIGHYDEGKEISHKLDFVLIVMDWFGKLQYNIIYDNEDNIEYDDGYFKTLHQFDDLTSSQLGDITEFDRFQFDYKEYQDYPDGNDTTLIDYLGAIPYEQLTDSGHADPDKDHAVFVFYKWKWGNDPNYYYRRICRDKKSVKLILDAEDDSSSETRLTSVTQIEHWMSTMAGINLDNLWVDWDAGQPVTLKELLIDQINNINNNSIRERLENALLKIDGQLSGKVYGNGENGVEEGLLYLDHHLKRFNPSTWHLEYQGQYLILKSPFLKMLRYIFLTSEPSAAYMIYIKAHPDYFTEEIIPNLVGASGPYSGVDLANIQMSGVFPIAKDCGKVIWPHATITTNETVIRNNQSYRLFAGSFVTDFQTGEVVSKKFKLKFSAQTITVDGTTITLPSAPNMEFAANISPSIIIPGETKLYTLVKNTDSSYFQSVRILREDMLEVNLADAEVVQEYLWELYYFVPMIIAHTLQSRSHFIDALSWYRSIFDYAYQGTHQEKKIFYGLVLEENIGFGMSYSLAWLQDPLNPHKLARTRQNSYTKYTLMAIAKCMIEYADSEFTLDTSESVPRARELYREAQRILKTSPELELAEENCLCGDLTEELIQAIICELGEELVEEYRSHIEELAALLAEVHCDDKQDEFDTLVDILLTDYDEQSNEFNGNFADNLDSAFEHINNFLEQQEIANPPQSIWDVLVADDQTATSESSSILISSIGDDIERTSDQIVEGVGEDFDLAISYVTGDQKETMEQDGYVLNFAAEGKDVSYQRVDEPDGPPIAAGTDYGIDMISVNFYPAVDKKPWGIVDEASEYPIHFVPILSSYFCIPDNPVFFSLRFKAELNLFKIRNCMNIAGMRRELDPYAAPTDTTTGLPNIGADGQMNLPGNARIKPTLYRYSFIIERAKQLAGYAQQIESSYMAALEKRDTEYYSLMRARQDLNLSKANVKLQELRLKVAEDQVTLAELQRDRSVLQIDLLQGMIDAGLNGYELAIINTAYNIAGLKTGMAMLDFMSQIISLANQQISGPLGSNTAGVGAALLGVMSIPRLALTDALNRNEASLTSLNLYSAFERRKQEWNFQKALAEQDIKIGEQSIKIAQDSVRVSNQEVRISEMQVDHAEDTVNFLTNKFTNVDLYAWMIEVLGGVYASVLQHATSTALMAQDQLAFERQQLPPGYIQSDYWETPTDSFAVATVGGNAPDRRGLTGSARLLGDLIKLDQYAFETDRRKHNLTKTISVAQYFPAEFVEFKQTGVLTFATFMEWFDRDFPGHYLRLIKRVKTTVVALVPPTEGIRATLTNSGISRVVIGGDIFQQVVNRRNPESIIITSPRESTGVFEMQPESPMMNPFEGTGVDTLWEFRMLKSANPINYDSIVDILITIEYTSLDDFAYRTQILRELPPYNSAELPLSLKNDLPDLYYELMHPEEQEEQGNVSFDLRKVNFPANLKNILVKDMKLYFVAGDDILEGAETAIEGDLSLSTINQQGVLQVVASGVFGTQNFLASPLLSTKAGNGGGLVSLRGKNPVGTWTLAFEQPAAIKTMLEEGTLKDIVIMIGFEGELPIESIV